MGDIRIPFKKLGLLILFCSSLAINFVQKTFFYVKKFILELKWVRVYWGCLKPSKPPTNVCLWLPNWETNGPHSVFIPLYYAESNGSGWIYSSWVEWGLCTSRMQVFSLMPIHGGGGFTGGNGKLRMEEVKPNKVLCTI